MYYTRKIKVVFTEEDSKILDGQSKICNWTYNQLLSACKEDYASGNKKNLLSGRNLRNYMVTMKKEKPFMKSVYAHVLQESANRLKKAYEKFFAGGGYPKYRSWSEKWFSLVYDEAKAVKIEGSRLTIPLGKTEDAENKKSRNLHITGTLTEELNIKENEKLKTCSITKHKDTFYAIFCIEMPKTEEEILHDKAIEEFKRNVIEYNKKKKEAKGNGTQFFLAKPVRPEMKQTIPDNVKWIALDPNHKNLFVGIDYLGNTVEFGNLEMIKYWDKQIDRIKSMRDKCIKYFKKKETEYGNSYYVHSPRWNRLNKALDSAYQKRNEQVKKACYVISHYLYDNYDLVIMGDYVLTKGTAPFSSMHRSMLNQTIISRLRKTIHWVSIKENKYFIDKNEKNTTKECCICGHMEKKDPDVRIFTCPCCNTTILRDVNSAVNIAAKAGYRPGTLENVGRLNLRKTVIFKTDKI